VIDREFDGRPKSFTFSITPSGEFYVSIVIECDGELPEKKAILPETTIGLDLNVVNLAYSSNGEITANPQPLEKELKKLKRMQRAFCKMEKGSKRREKQRIRIAKLHQHIANKRKDYAHKLTHALIMRYDTIVLEDLDIKGMMKNPRLARQIADCAWGYTGTYLEYKANLYGKNVIRVDQYYASTKICNSCGGYNDTVKLRNRTWKCTHCETDNEVDFNAALNLKKEGLNIVNDVASVK
jgi:putative transposase